MNCKKQNGYWRDAFTFIELLVVIAVLFVLTAMLAPAIAKSNGQAGRVTCFNNKRQLQAACAFYSSEWNDWLVPNAPAGFSDGWCRGEVNWGSVVYNTSTDRYRTNGLGPYLTSLKVYKCPNDRIPSDNGDRIRSISMSGAICGDLGGLGQSGKDTLQGYIGPYRLFSKTADLTAPGPANTWVFCDESMYTLNDGYMQMDMSSIDYPDVPAAYDLGGNCFSFADGHVEHKLWQFTRSSPPGGIPLAPYVYGVTGTYWPGAPGPNGDGDWLWLRAHTSVHQ